MYKRLPGDPDPKQLIEEVIRVNHAGEYGAKVIYEGQLAFLRDKEAKKLVQHMYDQELEHLEFFEQQMKNRNVRPSLLHPLWHITGFALGAVTAIMGKEAAFACTEAIEETIEAHYQEQIEKITDYEPEMASQIIKFKEEELEHRDIAVQNSAHNAPFYPVLSSLVRAGCRIAIAVAKKI